MRKNWNKKGRKTLCLLFLTLSSLLLAFCLILPQNANSGPYLDSAHGNTTYGVDRTGLSSFSYSKGNCAHCHEQHAMIGGSEPAPNSGDDAGPDNYLLFKNLWIVPPQSNTFCFGCHVGTGSLQTAWSRTNYSYSYWRGGDSITCPSSIYESFQFVDNTGASILNCGSSLGSSHMIRDIRTFMAGKAGFSSTTSEVDPCSGCHNPHRAKRDYPCSRPSAHANLLTWNVWGDDAPSERMNGLTATYWAPFRIGGGYEPDGSATQNGSNMTNYVSLCTDCHNTTYTINSTRLGRNLVQIDWSGSGDIHGNRSRNDSGMEWGDLKAPYKVSGSYQYANYVLNCTDCHEPHGSRNEYLMRRTVNGTTVNTVAGAGQWYYFCQTCHVLTVSNPMHTTPTYDCYQGSACHRHGQGASNLF